MVGRAGEMSRKHYGSVFNVCFQCMFITLYKGQLQSTRLLELKQSGLTNIYLLVTLYLNHKHHHLEHVHLKTHQLMMVIIFTL